MNPPAPQQQEQSAATSTEPGKKKNKMPTVVPSCTGPRRLAFRIRRRGFSFGGAPSLLVSNRFGVWSVSHRRYIRKTRYHRYCALTQDVEPVRAGHAALVRKLGPIHLWPEYMRAEVWPLRRRLADLYWSLWPDERKARAAAFYRRRRWLRWRPVWFAAPVTWMVMLGFLLLRALLLGIYSDETNLCLVAAYLAAAYLMHMAWYASAAAR